MTARQTIVRNRGCGRIIQFDLDQDNGDGASVRGAWLEFRKLRDRSDETSDRAKRQAAEERREQAAHEGNGKALQHETALRWVKGA